MTDKPTNVTEGVAELCEKLRHSETLHAFYDTLGPEAAAKLESLESRLRMAVETMEFAQYELKYMPAALSQWAGGIGKTITVVRNKLGKALATIKGTTR